MENDHRNNMSFDNVANTGIYNTIDVRNKSTLRGQSTDELIRGGFESHRFSEINNSQGVPPLYSRIEHSSSQLLNQPSSLISNGKMRMNGLHGGQIPLKSKNNEYVFNKSRNNTILHVMSDKGPNMMRGVKGHPGEQRGSVMGSA